MTSRGRHYTDIPSWEQANFQPHRSGSTISRSNNLQPNYHQSGSPSRHLQRHTSDVSGDRITRYIDSSAASKQHRSTTTDIRTDYPVASRKPRGSSTNASGGGLTSNRRSDSGLHLNSSRELHYQQQPHLHFRDSSQGSQGSQGSGTGPGGGVGGGGVVYRQKPSSSGSIDRSSYSAGDSHSSFNGSLREQATSKMGDNGYYHPTSLRTTGTPSSSQSDEFHIDRASSIGNNHPYRMPRSQSSQATSLSSYSKGFPSHQNDDVDGMGGVYNNRRYSGRDFHEGNTGTSVQQPYYPSQLPTSPVSPVSPVSSSSYSSDSGRYRHHSTQANSGGGGGVKAWYEEEDPDIVSGFYFPNSANKPVKPVSHHYETIPYSSNGPDVPGRMRSNHTPSPQPPIPPSQGYTDHRQLSKHRLEYLFIRQQNGSQTTSDHSHYPHDRRESSPADIGRGFPQSLNVERGSSAERKFSDSELMTSNQDYLKDIDEQKKIKRVKSGGGMGIGRLVKRIGHRKSRNKDEVVSDLKSSNRSHSLEHLDVKSHNSDTNLIRNKGESPSFTPKLSKQKHRQNSEPDLETAVGLFRSNSKKNLFIDPVEALFDAIQVQDYDTCYSILGESELDINAVNEDDWTPLDVAVMLNGEIASLLIQYGAKDSNKYCRDPSLRYNHVLDLLGKVEVEKRAIKDMNPSSKELQKHLGRWRNRSRVLEKMLETIQRSNPPGPPREVSLTVTSDRTLNVRFSEPESNNGAQVTRYKVEWSKNEHFVPESGEFILYDGRREYTIPDLDKGERYYVRVYAFNMKGFGPPRLASPSYAIPSSWHDYSNTKPRFQGCTTKMSSIGMGLSRHITELQQIESSGGAPGTPSANNKRSLKKGLTRLFSQGVRFSRTQKSGVYLASLMHSDEGRILVTVDDYLPIIEVSDSPPRSIGTDFSWLTKLSCTWENVREMCESTEGHTSSSSLKFRFQLLQAVAALQIGTGQSNLGLLHHKTFHDSHGTTVFLVVQYIEDYKSYMGGGNKWSNFVKVMKKYPQIDEVFGHELTESEKSEKLSAVEQLIIEIPSILHHHSNCHNMLSKGLYLGYLKARLSNLSSMTLVTSSTLPNVFPHYQIRPNPNISRDEWAWIQSLTSNDPEVTLSRVGTGNQVLQKTLLPSIEHFLEILGIQPDDVDGHQILIDEVIELNEDVTFLLITPPPDNVCTPPGGKDEFDGQHFSHLPISAFELLQLYTYQRAFVSNFSMVLCRLDVEIPIYQKRMREAHSTSERSALEKIKESFDRYYEDTESVWKQMRWIETAVQSARNSSSPSQLTVSQLRERIKVIRRSMSTSISASSISTMSSTSGGTLSPSRKSVPNVNSVIPTRQLTVYPGYDTGLPKGTTVMVQVNPSTASLDVIKYAVNEFEKAGRNRRFTEREFKEFYLAAVLGHHEDILPLDYTPLQMLNFSNKYKFIVRRFSLNQCTTEV